MIYYFCILFFIPLYIRFKASDELFHHKVFALFLIWFSRGITFFLLYHLGAHLLGPYANFIFPFFALYSFYRIYKERILILHSYNSSYSKLRGVNVKKWFSKPSNQPS